MKEVLKLEDCSIDEIRNLIGNHEENLGILEDAFMTEIILRGDEILLCDNEDKIGLIKKVIEALIRLVKKGKEISKRDVLYALKLIETDNVKVMDDLYSIKIARTIHGKVIYPKTLGQKEYYQALMKNDVVFGIGPAGTGKTYLAVVFAVDALKNNMDL